MKFVAMLVVLLALLPRCFALLGRRWRMISCRSSFAVLAMIAVMPAQSPAPPTTPAQNLPPTQSAPAPQAIKERLTLPQAARGEAYYNRLGVRTAGSPPWTWRLTAGRLPPGLTLGRDGVVSGTPTSAGDYRFTAGATDSAKPPRVVQLDVLLAVRDPLSLAWQQEPAVADRNGKGIFGSLVVANNSSATMDLTVIIVAVNETGRATALGYQHFPFAPGRTQTIPFGSTLPRGTYLVHADAVGEVARTNTILRTRQQSNPINVQ
jgi:hypothetical protein